jgi:hypothetical protein
MLSDYSSMRRAAAGWWPSSPRWFGHLLARPAFLGKLVRSFRERLFRVQPAVSETELFITTSLF